MNPRHLKASFLSALALLAVLLVSSCASSERMNRLGYDSDSYSAPKASRISGGRFDEAVVNLRAPVGLKDRQVNVWPFCTVNSRYVSILWPFIDWDDFGMAIRPFFNQEGNDCSILFPLCAWNTVDGDGWALNTYWNEDCYGSFPLFHIGKEEDSFWYVGPVFGARGRNSFGLFPLFFYTDHKGSNGFVGPVWWDHATEFPDEDSFGVFPLYWNMMKGRYHTLFPLYYYAQDDCFLSPLFWMFKTPDGNGNKIWGKGQYLILGYWDENGIEHGFVPFYRVDREDEDLNHVLLWWWKNNTETRGLFPFAWFDKDGGLILPFAKWKKRSATHKDGEEETWTEGSVLLLGYWDKNAWGVFPLFRGSSSEADMKYVGPLWWAYNEDEREYGFFPFFRVERSKGETNKSYLFPVYSWEKDRYGSEFTSIPFSREDYDYPEYRATTSVHGRRYLIYADHEKKGNRFKAAHERDDYIPRLGYSPSYLDDVKSHMKEDDLTSEEAQTKVNDAIASKWEVRTTSLHPFFEWTTSNEGERDLRLLFYLFGFDRDKDSSSNWLLWHILFTSGSDRSRDSFGFERTSSYTNVLGVFPYWFRDTETPYSAGIDYTPQGYMEETIEHLLKRALMEDGSEESEQWSRDLNIDYAGKKYIPSKTPVPQPSTDKGPVLTSTGKEIDYLTVVNPTGLRQIIPGIPNEDVFRVCGMDRALSGEMTAKEAEDTVKRLIDVELKMHASGGMDIQTRYGFFPLFGVDRTVREKDGETTPVSTEVLTPLTYTEITERESSTDVLLGILGSKSSETYYTLANGHACTDDSFSTLGLIRSSTEIRPRTQGVETLNEFAKLLQERPAENEDPLLADFWNLRVTATCNNALKRYARFKEIVAAVTAYRDGARTATDTQAMAARIVRWENEYFWEGDEVSSSSGFYPFFFWNKNCLDRNGELSDISKSWFVLPLLSGGTSNDEGSSFGILCPLLYYGATQRHDEAIPDPRRILQPSVNPLQASHRGLPVRGTTDHYALFLVNSTDETFLQWKLDTKEAIHGIYLDLYRLYTMNNVPGFTSAELSQMTVAEALNLTPGKFETGLTEYQRVLGNVLVRMEENGLKPPDKNALLTEALGTCLRGIAADRLVTRTITGFNTASGILSSSFTCEETGDYQTKVLFGLGANSRKLGEKEHRSILGYLYNMDTDGVNTRKFIFPFITTKDAPGFHEWSFLGGLFERSEEDGKTGGRIFFFPYGNRPGKD